MGQTGRRRVEQELSWECSRRVLVHFYSGLLHCDGSEQPLSA
jgi:hypothetical protein